MKPVKQTILDKINESIHGTRYHMYYTFRNAFIILPWNPNIKDITEQTVRENIVAKLEIHIYNNSNDKMKITDTLKELYKK